MKPAALLLSSHLVSIFPVEELPISYFGNAAGHFADILTLSINFSC